MVYDAGLSQLRAIIEAQVTFLALYCDSRNQIPQQAFESLLVRFVHLLRSQDHGMRPINVYNS
jgi:hypothetical protein